MMTLSTDWTALNNKIDQMTPTGTTNITIGLQVGWQSLTPMAPFNAPPEAADLDKVLILLTDGETPERLDQQYVGDRRAHPEGLR
jgi:hypothetical protein